jgi:hypothetical protein
VETVTKAAPAAEVGGRGEIRTRTSCDTGS